MTHRLLLGALLGLMSFTACKGDTVGLDDSGTTDDTDEVVGDADSPTVDELDAYCELHETGDQFYQWLIQGRANDPQGPDTLETMGLVEVFRGEGLIADTQLVVGRDGELVTSFNADTLGVPCSSAADFTFKVTVTDEDGNTGSGEVTGREQ